MKNRKKNRNRPELPRYMTQASVDDETSSTSTESSVGEIEEKVSSISRFGHCQRKPFCYNLQYIANIQGHP